MTRARQVIDPERAATALEWLNHFTNVTGRVPFLTLRHAGDIERAMYNAETLEALAEFMRVRGSRQRGHIGEPLKADTIDSYISAIKTIRSVEAHSAVTIDAINTIAPRASKQQRLAQPANDRALKRGIRASHLRILSALVDRTTAQGKTEWAAALLAHNIVLRGAELGTAPHIAFDPSRHLTYMNIEFREPCADSNWCLWLIVWLQPAKDQSGTSRRFPMAIQRRSRHCAFGADPMCTYDALIAAIQVRTGIQGPFRTGLHIRGPMARCAVFTINGRVWNTDDTRNLARRYARLLGLDPSEFGGKSFRIGGATDWRDVFGIEAERVTRERGRWASDIAHIYQRALASTHLRGSAAVGDATSADLESMCRGWAQPAIP
jgi:hypothetical protein